MNTTPGLQAERQYAIANGGGPYEGFVRDLKRLRDTGFADWLKASFCGPDPSPKPGWFYSNSDALFGQQFCLAAESFDDDARRVAAEGIHWAMAAFDPEQGVPYGLLELVGVAEAMGAADLLPQVAQSLTVWFDPDARAFVRGLESAEDVLILREILECAFRLSPAGMGAGSDSQMHFEPIAQWASAILLRHPHALRRAFVPAYAPMYMLALCGNTREADRKRMAGVVESGWRTDDDPFPSLFTFPSDKKPGAVYPYNYDRLTDLADRFLNESRGDVPTIQAENPFEREGALSATDAVFRPKYDWGYLKATVEEVMERELEPA